MMHLLLKPCRFVGRNWPLDIECCQDLNMIRE
jgi:hypothetical protein